MGLLDSVRSLLGGGAADGGNDATGGGSQPGEGRGGDGHRGNGHGDGDGGEAPPPGFERTGPAQQVHGSHWDTLLPDVDRERAITTLTMNAVSEGEVLDGHPVDGATVTGHRHADGPLGTMAVTADDEIATAYPLASGIEHDVDTTGLKQWTNGLEAWTRFSLGEAAITAFVTNYFRHPAEFFGGECRASIAVCMYDFGVADADAFVDEDGEERDVSEFVGFRPWDRGASDDYVYRTVVDSVETVSHRGYDAYRIEAPLFRRSNGRPVDVAFYVGDHLVDEPPAAGESVEGAGWLQARFHRGGG